MHPTSIIVAAASTAAILGSSGVQAADVTCAGGRHGITCFSAKGASSFTGKSTPELKGFFKNLASCGDHLIAVVGNAIVAYDGKAWTPAVKAPHYTNFASCHGKVYWIWGDRKVSRYLDGKWQSWSRDQVFPGIRGADARSIAPGPKGTAWVVTNRTGVAHFDGAKWTLYRHNKDFDRRYRFAVVTIDRKNRPWVVSGFALFGMDGAKWKIIARPGATTFASEAPDGKIWIGGGARRIAVHTPGGSTSEMELPYRPNHGVVDGKGRLWVTTRFGIGLWRDGKLDMRQMSNSVLASDNMSHIAVAGNGGALPDKIKATPASVSGKLVWDKGGPVAGARIQLCGSPVPWRIARKDTTPCGGLPQTFDGKSGADGTFRFSNVPPAIYRLSIQGPKSGKWVTKHLGRRGHVTAGATRDLKDVRVSERLK